MSLPQHQLPTALREVSVCALGYSVHFIASADLVSLPALSGNVAVSRPSVFTFPESVISQQPSLPTATIPAVLSVSPRNGELSSGAVPVTLFSAGAPSSSAASSSRPPQSPPRAHSASASASAYALSQQPAVPQQPAIPTPAGSVYFDNDTVSEVGDSHPSAISTADDLTADIRPLPLRSDDVPTRPGAPFGIPSSLLQRTPPQIRRSVGTVTAARRPSAEQD